MPQEDADHGVRQLVLVHGRSQARALVPPECKALVDIAAEVLSDEAQTIGITYSGFCLTSLPHKRLPDTETWEKKGHRVTLLVEPGRLQHGGAPRLYGVPYGARADDPVVSANAGGADEQPRGRTRPLHAGLAGPHGAQLGRRDRTRSA
jgi:hypothetical protein